MNRTLMKFYMDNYEETKDYQYLVGAYEQYLSITPTCNIYNHGFGLGDYDEFEPFVTWVDNNVKVWNGGASFGINEINGLARVVHKVLDARKISDVYTMHIPGIKEMALIGKAIRLISELNFKLMGLSIDKYGIVYNSTVWIFSRGNDLYSFELEPTDDELSIVHNIDRFLEVAKKSKAFDIIIRMFKHFFKTTKENIGAPVEELLKQRIVLSIFDREIDRGFTRVLKRYESFEEILIKYEIIDDKGIDGIIMPELDIIKEAESLLSSVSEVSVAVADAVIKYNELSSAFPEILSKWLYYSRGEYDDYNIIEDLQLEDCSDVNIGKVIAVRDALNELIKTHSTYTELLNK